MTLVILVMVGCGGQRLPGLPLGALLITDPVSEPVGVTVSTEPWGPEAPPLFGARWKNWPLGALLRLSSPETGRAVLVQVVGPAEHPTINRAAWDRLGETRGLRVQRITGQVGVAEVYPLATHGLSTASGELRDLIALNAGHRFLPFGSIVRVRSLQNGKTVLVRINDRVGFETPTIIVLTPRAAGVLEIDRQAPVAVEFLTTRATGM